MGTDVIPRYVTRHIATDPLHIKREPRYAVIDRSDGSTITTFMWARDAKDEAQRLSILAGACRECTGAGSIIADWGSSPDGDVPLGSECPRCKGTGRDPEGE